MPTHESSPNPITEFYTEVYHAFDTTVADQARLNAERDELHAEVLAARAEGHEVPEDTVAATGLIREARQRIEERRTHVLGAVIGRSDVVAGTHEASRVYVAGFDPEEQAEAALRVAVYNSLIRATWKRQRVPDLEGSGVPTGQTQVRRVYGTPDPETGRLWVPITDPRAVEIVGGGAREDQVVERYPILSQSLDETGQLVVVIGNNHLQQTLTIPVDSRAFRVGRNDGDDVLELFIPAGTVSVGEAAIDAAGGYIAAGDEATQVAAQVAGANLPSIFDRLQPPRGDPRPIRVPKTQ